MLSQRQKELIEQLMVLFMAVAIAWFVYSDSMLIKQLQTDVATLRQENAALHKLIQDAEVKINTVDRKTMPDAIQKAMFNWLEGKE